MHNWHPPAQVLNCVELLIILYEFFFEKQIGYGAMLNLAVAIAKADGSAYCAIHEPMKSKICCSLGKELKLSYRFKHKHLFLTPV